jgi:hypothetical protein
MLDSGTLERRHWQDLGACWTILPPYHSIYHDSKHPVLAGSLQTRQFQATLAAGGRGRMIGRPSLHLERAAPQAPLKQTVRHARAMLCKTFSQPLLQLIRVLECSLPTPDEERYEARAQGAFDVHDLLPLYQISWSCIRPAGVSD